LCPFLGVFKSSVISLLVLFISSLILYFKDRGSLKELQLATTLYEGICLALVVFLIGFFTHLSVENNILLDFKFHLSAANYILRSDNFPFGYSNWPELIIPYHYAFDLFSASLSSLSKTSIINVFKLVAIFSSVITFLSAYSIARFLSNQFDFNKSPALLAALFFYFSTNLLFFDSMITSSGSNLFKTICSIGLHGSIFNDLGSSGIFLPSLTLGIPLFLLIMYFLFLSFNSKELDKKLLFSIAVIGFALFQNAEYIVYVLCLTLLLCSLISYKNIKLLIPYLIFAFIIVFNSISFKLLSSEFSYIPGFLDITFNSHFPKFLAFGRFGDLKDFREINIFSWQTFSEIGLFFSFLVFTLIWFVKKKPNYSLFLTAFFLVSFIFPFLILIKSSPPDSMRILHPGLEFLSLVFILYFMNSKYKLKWIITIFLIPSILKLILSGMFTNSIYLNYKYIDHINSLIEKYSIDKDFKTFSSDIKFSTNIMKESITVNPMDEKVAKYLKDKNGYGISLNPLPFDLVGVPCYMPRAGSISRGRTFRTVLDTLDLSLVKELKIKWLYLDPETDKYINHLKFEQLISQGYIKKALEVNDDFNYKKSTLYEFNNFENAESNQSYYWTLTKYIEDEPISLNNSLYLFKTENEANDYIRNVLLKDSGFKDYKFFTNAVSKELIDFYADKNGLKLVSRP
jgi:hypothetical protein